MILLQLIFMGLVHIYNVHAVGYSWTLISTLFFALAPRRS